MRHIILAILSIGLCYGEDISVMLTGEMTITYIWEDVETQVNDVYPDALVSKYRYGHPYITHYSDYNHAQYAADAIDGNPDRVIWVYYVGDRDAHIGRSQSFIETELDEACDNAVSECEDNFGTGVTVEFLLVKTWEGHGEDFETKNDAVDAVIASRSDCYELDITAYMSVHQYWVYYLHQDRFEDGAELVADAVNALIAAGSG
jgi:hypothetical protein